MAGKSQHASEKHLHHELSHSQSQRCGKLYRDTVFTSEDWESHISFRRYLPEPRILYVPCTIPLCLMYSLFWLFHVFHTCMIFNAFLCSWHGVSFVSLQVVRIIH